MYVISYFYLPVLFSRRQKVLHPCTVQPDVLSVIKSEDLRDGLNITPTLSEAHDMVQMEEMERELMDDVEGKEEELNGRTIT